LNYFQFKRKKLTLGLGRVLNAAFPYRNWLGDSLPRQIKLLISKYERHAKVAFSSAQKEDTDFSKRFIEYGAIINFNHAQDLRRLLNG